MDSGSDETHDPDDSAESQLDGVDAINASPVQCTCGHCGHSFSQIPQAKHKILCGDSRIKEHTDKLFEDGLPFMMVTDPPYGVNYDPEWRHRCGLNNSDRIGSVTNDGIADWTDVWRAFPGRVAYVWHGGLHSGTVQKSLEDAGFAVRSQILWVKPRLVISRGHYHWKHEPAFEAERAGQPAVPSPDQPSELIAETELACESEAWYAARKGESTKWVGGRK